MRDEDQRADRQPEFHAARRRDVVLHAGGSSRDDGSCMRYVWQTVLGIELPAVRAPDASRSDREIRARPSRTCASASSSPMSMRSLPPLSSSFFKSAVESGGSIVALRYSWGAALSRRELRQLDRNGQTVRRQKGMVWISLASDGSGPLPQSFSQTPTFRRPGPRRVGAEQGDAILLFADTAALAHAVAGKMRNEVGERCRLRDPQSFAFVG